MEIKTYEFRQTDTTGLPELKPPPELVELPPATPTHTTDGALIGNPIYGEVPATAAPAEPPVDNGKFKSKYPKQNMGTLDKIRAHQAEIRSQKAQAEAASQQQTVAEMQQILDSPPPTAGEQLKETWGRLKALVKSIKIIDVQPIQELPPSIIEKELLDAKALMDKQHTYVPKSEEEAREIEQIAREAVSPQLAAENRASDIARALEASITDSNTQDEVVMQLVRDYMNDHTEITVNRNMVTRRAYERIVNKLAARRTLERNNPGFIKKISVGPTQPIIIPTPTRQPETPIHIGPTHPEPVEQQPQRPQVNVEVAAKLIANRIQTDLPRNIETEATRAHRELEYQNPEAVVGVPLPLVQETTDDMVQRNIDAVLINNPGIVDHETRNAIEARVRETAQDRIALVDRTNIVAQRILNGIQGRTDITTLNAAVDQYLADHGDEQDLNRNEVVQRIHSLHALRPTQAAEVTQTTQTTQTQTSETQNNVQQAAAPAPEAPIPPDDHTPPEKIEPQKILSPREKEAAQYDAVTNAIYDITYKSESVKTIHEIDMYIDRYMRLNNLSQDTNRIITLPDGSLIRRDRLAKNLLNKFNGTSTKVGLWQTFKKAWGF